ncbi:MAG: hypothetical protein EOM78_05150 [Erysipelotrichia bacterium]|nr:hypothetical protein [Erysipelotrichia bacterium]
MNQAENLKQIESKTLEVISLQKIILGYLKNIDIKINPIDLEVAIESSILKMEEVLEIAEKE